MATETTTSPRLFPFHIGRRQRSPTSPTFDDSINPTASANAQHRSPRRASFTTASQVATSAPGISIAASLSAAASPPSTPTTATPPATTTSSTNSNSGGGGGAHRPFVAMLRRTSSRPQPPSPHHQNTTNNNEAPTPPLPTSLTSSTQQQQQQQQAITTNGTATTPSAGSMPSSNAVTAPGQASTNANNQSGASQQPQSQLAQNQTHQNPRPLPGTVHRIRLVPHLESARSLPFEPIIRDAIESGPALRVGRFTDRQTAMASAPNAPNALKIAFRSKVVSRGHAEIWVEAGGKFFLKDTKSSSGTFLNHVRLANANIESRPYPLKDGDIIQLGIDYQGGQQEIYRCVKIKVEIGREWQAAANSFNTNALRRLQAYGVSNVAPSGLILGPASSIPANLKPQIVTAPPAPLVAPQLLVDTSLPSTSQGASTSQTPALTKTQHQQAHLAALNAQSTPLPTQDCCICLFPVTVCQALFVAPCSHAFHYKCMRPMLLAHHPGFSCPLCRSFADLESDVEVDVPEGYLKFGSSGNGSGTGAEVGAGGVGLEDVIEEEFPLPAAIATLAPPPRSPAPGSRSPSSAGAGAGAGRSPVAPRSPAIPHIEMDDTSELARASEAISISGNRSPIIVSSSANRLQQPQQQQSPPQYASNATPVADSLIDDVVHVGPGIVLPGSHHLVHHVDEEYEGEEEAMLTSEAEAEERARRRRYEEEDEDVDEDGHPIDPASRRFDEGLVHGRGAEEDEEEEDEVNAHIGIAPASVDGSSDIVDRELTPRQLRTAGRSGRTSQTSPSGSGSGSGSGGEGMMLVDSDPFYDHEVDELEIVDVDDEDEEDDMSEMGGAVPSSRNGGAGGVGNATLVAGEKRKHRDRVL